MADGRAGLRVLVRQWRNDDLLVPSERYARVQCCLLLDKPSLLAARAANGSVAALAATAADAATLAATRTAAIAAAASASALSALGRGLGAP